MHRFRKTDVSTNHGVTQHEERFSEFESLSDVEKVVSHRIVDGPLVLLLECGWSANMERIMEAQDLRVNSMTQYSKNTMEVNST